MFLVQTFADRCRSSSVNQDRPGRSIRSEIIGTFDRKQLGETAAGSVDAALDSSNGAVADFCRFLVGEARRADQDQGFALVVRQFGKCGTKLLEFDSAA